MLTAGTVPEAAFMSADFLGADWKGMNVILEYNNVQTDMCQTQVYARKWADLSNMTLGDSAYNAALQNITDMVTSANAAPGRPNGSAIGRIRTNERIFSPSGQSSYPQIFAPATRSWEISDWELRQFEINPSTHLIGQVPVTNTPVSSANFAAQTFMGGTNNNILFFAASGLINNGNANFVPNPLIYDTTRCNALIDWAFNPANTSDILLERHVMPNTFPGTSMPMTAGSALLQMDYVHALDFRWKANTTHHTGSNYTATGDYTNDRLVRHKLSLNSCQGCHAGETKTLFTQVRPLGYGESADYTGTTPGYESDLTNTLKLDTRFTLNGGTSKVWHGSSYKDDSNYSQSAADANRFFVKVSPFITGRNYSGTPSSVGFDDDKPDDANDQYVSGEFYVNDPMNVSLNTTFAITPRKYDIQNAFNQLKQRIEDLCSLIKDPCITVSLRPARKSVAVQVATLIIQQPHYPGWH